MNGHTRSHYATTVKMTIALAWLEELQAGQYVTQPFGQVAQLVEQRTENPRVGGSIPSLAIP